MMVPQNTRLQGEYVLWEDRMEQAGLTRDQLPDTMKGLLDFLIAWKQERGEPEEGEMGGEGHKG